MRHRNTTGRAIPVFTLALRVAMMHTGFSEEALVWVRGRDGIEPRFVAEAGDTGRSMTARVRVVIVDDHALVREGTVQLLDTDPDIEVVGQAGTAEEGLELLDRLSPDLAVIDVNLPDASGIELARTAAAHYPTVRVLVVSAYDDHAYVSEALEVGVGGYLVKTASARELLDAVRAVSDGVFVLDKAISLRLSRLYGDRSTNTTSEAPLTPRETDVLVLLAQGLSNKRIAGELGLGLRTIESYVSNVLSKLNVASRTEAVLYALGHHLIDRERLGG